MAIGTKFKGVNDQRIATSALYIVQETVERQDVDVLPMFPCPTPTWPPLPDNGTNTIYDPFGYPDSEVPVTYDDINNFFKEYTSQDQLIGAATGIVVGAGVVATVILAILGAISGVAA